MAVTPMMEQYLKIKEKYKDAILFFRLGDFYEMFYEDAEIAAKELEIALTGRDAGTEERAPMAGVPYHAADFYIDKLIKKGYKVAICEQLEDPAKAKGLVKRDVVRIYTPGTIINPESMDEKTNNYLVSVFKGRDNYGICAVDVTTGDLYATELKNCKDTKRVYDEITKYAPSEIIANEDFLKNNKYIKIFKNNNCAINIYEKQLDYEEKIKLIETQFNKKSEELGIKDKPYMANSLAALFSYLQELQKTALKHINKLLIYEDNSYMGLDSNAIKNLEILESNKNKSKKGSLLGVLDKTVTPMGGRLLKKWLEEPLLNKEHIDARLQAVEELFNDYKNRQDLKQLLNKIYDLERLASKIVYQSINPKDFISIKLSLQNLPYIKEILEKFNSRLLKEICEKFDILQDIYELIDKSIKDDPSTQLKEGNIIKDGYNETVDKLRKASTEGKNWIANLEAEEREKTGIKNLRIGYNKVFGYYIEVTKSNIPQVPERFIRKQTLANAERYVTPELKEIEETILGAEEKLIELEYQLFNEIREKVELQIVRIQNTAKYIAIIDVLISFAEVAETNRYIKPIVDYSDRIVIKEGRHPVIETISDESFVANDIDIGSENPIMIITGPNMAGKSTYMRQVALIVLMAQIGSFVPASYAKIGIVDKIFTRVGASDDIFAGQSTFMVEMSEVANILKSATSKSLIILDEVGRGTSTYDGMSIAHAVIEYIHEKIKAKTLFATHYHELTKLEGKMKGVRNYNVSVEEREDDIIFLRKIVPGGADKSYGIQVSKLAGLPYSIVERAKEILNSLENDKVIKSELENASQQLAFTQIDIFSTAKDSLIDDIANCDVDNMTPIQALNYLYELKEKAISLRSGVL
ncbi:DNA mismatch repair protein MutS [Thermoanaerobacter brockii subsp. lactiethylicus]|nr:MAG: DNA mismatch repair protein MutS [Thermoanaerobacter thermocopriae]MBZ4655544.1 mismatch repair protein MutS [Thermoanaerobacter sp.]MDI3500582.1 mismatch repair protein MutS [Thermoanaerobacter sp.]MDI3529510.1 mismatch repair protein MutS [Thermoanaerobacter sp.]